MATLGENRYGKSRVRVMKVVRHETHHAMKEWNVRVLLMATLRVASPKATTARSCPPTR
jgi:urate oxidase